MLNKEDIKEMGEWAAKTGIDNVNRPVDINLSWILSWNLESLREITVDEILDVMLKTGAYNTYLKSVKGSLSAQMTVTENSYKRSLYSATTRLGEHGNYKSKEEREALALDADPRLQVALKKLTKIKAQYNKIKEITQAIDSLMIIMKLYVNKRMR